MTTIAIDEREILVDEEADGIFQLKYVKNEVMDNFQLKAKRIV